MSNLESKLNLSLNEVLRSSGYIFEFINNNKKQSNLITGTNNQLITTSIAAQLSTSITKFDDTLDDAVSKLSDARWCIEQILENKQKEEELRLREEEERQRKLKEEEEREAKKRAENEQRARAEEANRRQEMEEKRRKEQAEEEKKKKLLEKKNSPGFDNFMSPGFNFNDLPNLFTDNLNTDGIPDPSDILSSINYKDFNLDTNPGEEKEKDKDMPSNDLDLDMNNLLGNDDMLLDGLNLSLLDQAGDNPNNPVTVDENFDVDSFLNQLGDGD